MEPLSVVFAFLAAASNAVGTVAQRRAASTLPLSESFRLKLIVDLLHRPVWFAGFGAVILAALLQALALSLGALALVQPIFVLELPLALLIGGIVFRRPLARSTWLAVLAVVAGLAVVLAGAAPSGGTLRPPGDRWALASGICVAVVAGLVAVALRSPAGSLRAACLGGGSAVGNALTAALLKYATQVWKDEGASGFFLTWQTYAFAITGVGAIFLLENAMQAGPLVASQPALTLGDALVGLLLGVTLYEERVRTGWWLIPELLGATALLIGALLLARAPLGEMLMSSKGRPRHSDQPGPGAD